MCSVFFLTQYAFDDERDVLLTEGMPVQGLGLTRPDWATQLLGYCNGFKLLLLRI